MFLRKRGSQVTRADVFIWHETLSFMRTNAPEEQPYEIRGLTAKPEASLTTVPCREHVAWSFRELFGTDGKARK
jgi:hypothetical protein